MPSTARWPDFLSASKLRHFMGTQSSVSDGVATDKSSSFPGGLGREDNYLDDPEAAGFDEHMAALSDTGEQQIEVTEAEGFEDYPNEEAGDDADADFGDLQVFDSNAPPPSIPAETSQLVESAGNSPPPESASRRTKKKKSRAKADAVAEAEAAELEASAGKKRKRSKRKSSIDLGVADGHEQDHGWAHLPATELSQSFVDVEAATSDMRAHEVPNLLSTEKKKKKRRTSDLEDGKRRKKRKPHDLEVEDDVLSSQGGDPTERHAGFLRTDRHDDVDVLDAIDEDGGQDPDSQLSPSVARLRRRSLSAGLRSRENSVPPRAAIAPMAVDGLSQDMGPSNNEKTDHADEDDGPEAVVAGAEDDVDVDVEVEDMVRQAWREHVSTQQEERHDETEEQDAEGEEHEEDPVAEPNILVNPAPEQREEQPKKRRYTKKQKPPIDETAVAEEASSNPKSRGKIATKRSRGRPPKQPEAPSAAQEEKQEAEEEEEEESRHYAKGRFTDAEFSRLTTTLENFRVEHGLTQVELNSMIHAPGGTTAGHAHAELWQRLSAECPNRKRQKVINVTRKKFHNFVARGTWTVEQDEELTKLIDEHGTAWSKIAAIINRHPEDVRDRYRNYIVCGSSQRKDVWTQEEQDLLRHHINEAMEAVDDLRRQSPDQILLQKSYEELIDWQNISEKMGRTRSRLQCITKWKALNNPTPRRKAPERKRNGEPRFSQAELDGSAISKLEVARQKLETMGEDERYRLVMAIHQSGVTESAKIPWAKLLDKDFRKNWSRTCRLLLWHRFKQSVPEFEEKSVQEITQFLIDHFGQTGGFPQLDPGYDFQREVEIVRRLRPREASMQQKKENLESHHGSGDETQTKSAKLVAGEEEDDLDMNIDPALSQMHVAGGEEKPMPSRRQSIKTAIEEEDPIEDVDSSGEGGGMKKAGRLGKKSGRDYRIAISDKNGNDGFGTPYMSSSDSEMANLMDLPARI